MSTPPRKKNTPNQRQGSVERMPQDGSVRQQIVAQSMQGPLPPPHMLAEYEHVHPGLAHIIVESFQRETAHRHDMENQAMAIEKHVAENFVKERRRGQHYGLLIAIMLVVGSVTLGWHGQGWAAAVMGGVGFASIVGAFVAGRRPPEEPNRAPSEKSQSKK